MKAATTLLSVVGLLCVEIDGAATPSSSNNLNPQLERADAVKQTFQIAWDGYKKYAFPNDELAPLSNGFLNPRY